jgi:hypothetical protein
MAEYPPPVDDTPIFNSQEFLIPLNASISRSEADARYLARTGSAISVADTTSFIDQITVGSALIDYIPAQGVQIRPTINSEALFLRVLDGTGVTKQRIECNATHQHLYDTTRITESATPTNHTTLQQTGTTLDMYNTTTSGTMTFRTETSAGAATTPLSLSSTSIAITPSQTATGLNGLVVDSAMFGRNDTSANTFGGTLGYTRHPIGWTVYASKSVAPPTSNVTMNAITEGTPTTIFNNLSNGVWRISCSCNNAFGAGTMTYVKLDWGAPTGATILNGTTPQLYHQFSSGLTTLGAAYPDLIIRTTGNGTTAVICNFYATYSVQPTITFNWFGVKIA